MAQQTKTENLRTLVALLGSHRKAGEAIGAAPSTITGWLKDESMPLMADLACRQVLEDEGAAVTLYIITCHNPEHGAALETIFTSMGLKFTKEGV